MKTLTNLEKFGLAAALIVACTFFYMKYMYDPQTKVLKNTLKKRNQIVSKVNALKEIPPLFRLEKTIEQDQKRLADLRKENEKLSVNTGNPDEITRLLSQISKEIEISELLAVSIVPKAREPGRYIDWSPFEMDLKGSFKGFMRFVESMKAFNDAVEINNIQMKTSGLKSHPLDIHFTLRI